MSIRALAQDYYRSVRRLDDLEKRLLHTTLTPADRADLQEEIRKACAERDQLKAMLDGAKDD
jgi:CRISPR/Cas system-associated endonuclease/helicase Cas3